MSWHFSRALEEEFSAVFCWDGGQSEPWKSAPFARDESCSDKMKDTFHLSPFGTMFVPSTDALGAELLMSYLAGFRAKTSARQGPGRGSKEPEADSGANMRESLEKFNRATCSSKIARSCELAGLSESSKTLPPSGTMQNGWCYPRKRSVPTICESGCGLQLPPPRSTDGDRGGRGDLLQAVRGNKNSHFKLFPTPQGIAKEIFPTPNATDYKGASTRSPGKARPRCDDDLPTRIGGGLLNPTWVEWLMGWPLGWTDLELLGTDKFHLWLQLHGRS